MFRLHATPLSARKVLAVSHHLGLVPEIVRVDVYQGESRDPGYLAINPQGQITTLVDGDLVRWESVQRDRPVPLAVVAHAGTPRRHRPLAVLGGVAVATRDHAEVVW